MRKLRQVCVYKNRSGTWLKISLKKLGPGESKEYKYATESIEGGGVQE